MHIQYHQIRVLNVNSIVFLAKKKKTKSRRLVMFETGNHSVIIHLLSLISSKDRRVKPNQKIHLKKISRDWRQQNWREEKLREWNSLLTEGSVASILLVWAWHWRHSQLCPSSQLWETEKVLGDEEWFKTLEVEERSMVGGRQV